MLRWLRPSPEEAAAPTPAPAPDTRLYAVGDIHGRADLLAALLPRLEADARTRKADGRRTVLVFLGDYVDRGDHSRAVLDLLAAAGSGWAEPVFLRGNHEAALLDFLTGPETGAEWLAFGGLQTLASYGVPIPAPLPAGDTPAGAAVLRETAARLGLAMGEHIRFLARTHRLYRSGDVICSHAGIDPARPLEAQDDDALLWGRPDLPSRATPPGLRVVHGHFDGDAAVVTPGRICVDTGAYYSGRLTAVRLDAEETLLWADIADLP